MIAFLTVSAVSGQIDTCYWLTL